MKPRGTHLSVGPPVWVLGPQVLVVMRLRLLPLGLQGSSPGVGRLLGRSQERTRGGGYQRLLLLVLVVVVLSLCGKKACCLGWIHGAWCRRQQQLSLLQLRSRPQRSRSAVRAWEFVKRQQRLRIWCYGYELGVVGCKWGRVRSLGPSYWTRSHGRHG